jgi:aryl-alcohol dehydrogenase-like predicted oxidoreductase
MLAVDSRRRGFQRNLRIVDEVRAIGAEIEATPAQTAPTWILPRGNDIAPHSRNPSGLAELNAAQLERLNNLTPAAGARHDEANRASIDQ